MANRVGTKFQMSGSIWEAALWDATGGLVQPNDEAAIGWAWRLADIPRVLAGGRVV